MNNKLTVLIIGIFLFVIRIDVYAQDKREFSYDQQKWLSEISEYFDKEISNSNENVVKTFNKKKENKHFFEQFSLVWNSDKFSEQQRQAIYLTSNKMLKKKLKAFPHFKNYLLTLMSFVNTEQSLQSFSAWQKTLESLLNLTTSTKFIEFLSISNSLFSENILYQSNSVTWQADNNNYHFEFDSIPTIIFPSLTLKCYAKKDSSIILNTKGLYYPTELKWEGEGGKVTWERAGFHEDSVYAILSKYTINIQFTYYNADSITFYNKMYFDAPLMGSINEKIMADVKSEEKATYPRFNSYVKRFKISNLFPDIDYDGGFSLNGAQFIGRGSDEEDAYFIFKSKYMLCIANSKSYIISKDRISSQDAGITFFFEKDSIYHPSIELKYLEKERNLSLFRDRNSTPIFDSYHKLDILTEAIYWNLKEPRMIFTKVKSINPESEAYMESANYFDVNRFEKIKGLSNINPLYKIRDFCRDIKSNTFPAKDYAFYNKSQFMGTKTMLLNLADLGFLFYDSQKDIVTVKDKLVFYTNARIAKTDYDVIKFHSKINKRDEDNAILNLLNFDLKVNGIQYIALSDSQNVTVSPRNDEIIIKKNRDFVFSGHVNTTAFTFFGDDFYFDYDNFKIVFTKEVAMGTRVPSTEKDEYGRSKTKRVTSIIEGIKGDLQIDHPNNKSSRKVFPEYPIINSTKDSYVYYDASNIQSGVYSRNSFYFHLEPFRLDSLEKMSFKNLSYKGTMVSAGIFPDFQEDLKIQKDYSLGFERKTPTGGYPAYNGKGTYQNTIKLNNDGFTGDGILKYLTSKNESEKFIFFPDSTNAEVFKTNISAQAGQVEYPEVNVDNAYMHWEPYKNIMHFYSKESPFAMYDQNSYLTGNLRLTPEYLHGTGSIGIKAAELVANLYRFKKDDFRTDTCDFSLKNEEFQQLGFKTQNFSANIDYKKRNGNFKSNGEASVVTFDINKYICYMSEFTWFMDGDEIELSKDADKIVNTENMTTREIADLDISGSKFISIKNGQDSLNFYSARATYKLKESIIYCKDVSYIHVADAYIYPDNRHVTILRDAEIKTLEKAKILANTTTQFHEIYNATANIYGRKKYFSNGDYDYISTGLKKQIIHFTKVTVDDSLQTYGLAEIPENSEFQLSPYYDFYGKINLYAKNRFLTYKGLAKVKELCTKVNSSWFKFESSINPENIFIQVDSACKGISNQNLYCGFMLASGDSAYIYPTFFSEKVNTRRGREDKNILTSYGFVHYEDNSKEYKVSSYDRLAQNTGKDNYISFNTEECALYGDGDINFLENLGALEFKNMGRVYHYSDVDSTTIEMFMLVNFFFENDALDIIGESLEKNTTLKPLDPTNEQYISSLRRILKKEEVEASISQLTLNGKFNRLPNDLRKTFVLSNIKMKWNNKTSSFISYDKLGVSNILKKQLYKYTDGVIELKKRRNGDELTIYLSLDGEKEWYIFQYLTRNNEMRVFSSNSSFNEKIEKLSSKNRTTKSKEAGSAPFSFKIASERLKRDFLKNISE
ncbi:MAG: hypothetical protein A2X12_03625 [Bacteroidetes bacterium GWE2_29_8]|nr:MAG: hypothetical protein A2X12_03625 [Bacteroidetes bacterium GWE2_29_8]